MLLFLGVVFITSFLRVFIRSFSVYIPYVPVLSVIGLVVVVLVHKQNRK